MVKYKESTHNIFFYGHRDDSKWKLQKKFQMSSSQKLLNYYGLADVQQKLYLISMYEIVANNFSYKLLEIIFFSFW